MKKIIFKSITRVILIFLIVFSISKFVHKKVTPMSDRNRDYIVYNMEKKPTKFLLPDDGGSNELFNSLFEGLVRSNEDGEMIGAIAESWAISKDETCYTFKIREEARESNGSKITAYNFVELFNGILTLEKGNRYIGELYYIVGAEEYSNTKKNVESVNINAIDKNTLQITLKAPCKYFLSILAHPMFAYRTLNSDLDVWNGNYKKINYSGPYVISNITEKNEVILVKNEHYWNKEQVKSKELHITFIENSEEVLADFKTGSVDIFKNPPLNEKKKLEADDKIITKKNDSVSAINFNLSKKNIVSNMDFRKALAISINRQKLNDNIFYETSIPALSYIPKTMSDGINGKYTNKDFFSISGNVDRAREFLKESNYIKGGDKLIFVYLNDSQSKKICENIVKSFKDDIKLNFEIKGLNGNEYKEAIKNHDYDLLLSKADANYNYPTAFLDDYKLKHSYAYENKEFDNILSKVEIEKNPLKRKELIQTAESVLINDAVVIPILFNTTLVCRENDIEGIYFDKKGNVRLDKIYKR